MSYHSNNSLSFFVSLPLPLPVLLNSLPLPLILTISTYPPLTLPQKLSFFTSLFTSHPLP